MQYDFWIKLDVVKEGVKNLPNEPIGNIVETTSSRQVMWEKFKAIKTVEDDEELIEKGVFTVGFIVEWLEHFAQV